MIVLELIMKPFQCFQVKMNGIIARFGLGSQSCSVVCQKAQQFILFYQHTPI